MASNNSRWWRRFLVKTSTAVLFCMRRTKVVHFVVNMQNLGLSDSTPHTQGRLKSLAWPSIVSDYDVDYLTRQGFSICFMVAGLSLLMCFATGPIGLLFVAFYYLAGVGIRVRSRFAAVSAFVIYSLDIVISLRGSLGPMMVIRVIVVALLAANVRATFLASRWNETRTEPPPLPVGGGFFDNFGDVWPHKIWPAGQYFFYVLAVVIGLAMLAGVAVAWLGVLPRAS